MKALILSLSLFFFCGCSTAQQSSSLLQPAQSQPRATQICLDETDSAVWDFGQVQAGQVYSHKFILRNSNDKPLNIVSTTTSCGCTVSSIKDKVLAPGQHTSIEVKLDTKGYKNKVTQFVYVNTDDERNPVLRLTVNADVK